MNYNKLTKEELIAIIIKRDEQRINAGKARWKNLSKKQKSDLGKKMIETRWKKYRKELSTGSVAQ